MNQSVQNVKRDLYFQLIAAFAVSFGPFAVGLGKGYPSPAIASMMNVEGDPNSSSIAPLTALEIDSGEASWIASLSLLGALFGGLTSGIVLRRGRKRALALISLPFAASWMLTTFATCVEMMYLTAFLVGAFSAIAQLATQVRHEWLRDLLLKILRLQYGRHRLISPRIISPSA